jgi:hypothetical protein
MPIARPHITQKERLRSYAAIFSSSSFAHLLRTCDFDFINSKIARYDQNKLGTKFTTYSEYIRYVYNQLKRDYRCEYIYKNEIINELLLKKYGTLNTVVINEFKVGRSVADMVLFNGTSKAFEIKTELDSERRLSGQLNDYTRIFRECYIVTHESLIEKYQSTDENIGLIAIMKHGRTFHMEEVRKATINSSIDADILIRSIRTQEYKNIVISYFGELPKTTNFQMYNACLEQMKNIPTDALQHLFITELKKRASNTQSLNTYVKELRQLCLSMKITPKQYLQLDNILSQTIKI